MLMHYKADVNAPDNDGNTPLHLCTANGHEKVKKALYLSVNVFSTKVLIEDTIFTSPNGDGTAILRGHPSHVKV